MFALTTLFRRKGMLVWQIVFCLGLLSFLFRSVIPVGYMPDFSGAGDGKFAVTICSAAGNTSFLPFDLLDHSGKSAPDDGAGSQDCPFGMAATLALAPVYNAAPISGEISDRPVLLTHDNQALPPLPALGPPLGSRAPPYSLG